MPSIDNGWLLILAAALVLDRWLGEPDWLWGRVPHPVVLFGRVIDTFDRWRDGAAIRGRDFSAGVLLLAVFAGLAFLIWIAVRALDHLLPGLGLLVELAIVAILVAHRSLAEHVRAVATGLARSPAEGRNALAMIVGRDVRDLDGSDVRRAALESLAENASDGVVAPVFWYLVAGLPGIVFYKAVNTADSMIGHRTERFERFGKSAAVLDDWLNWAPARLTAMLVWVIVRARRGSAQAAMLWQRLKRDAPGHRSPNAGWPETAFAVALGVRFGGPRRYGHAMVDGAVLNPEGAEEVGPAVMEQGLELFDRLFFLLLFAVLALWLFLGFL